MTDEMLDTASAPPRRSGGRLSGCVGALGCLVVLALLIGVGAVFAVGTERIERLFEAPDRTVQRFLTVVQDGDLRAGYDFLCEEYRRGRSEGAFATELREQREGLGPSTASVRDTFPRGLDRFSVYVSLKGTVRSRTVETSVIREDWEWRICGFDWS
jgi:hypothetical protein